MNLKNISLIAVLMPFPALKGATAELQQVSMLNDECGENPYVEVIRTLSRNGIPVPDSESIRTFFKNFQLSSTTAGTVTKSCALNTRVRIPAGFLFKPTSVTAEGFHALAPSALGYIRVDYVLQTNDFIYRFSNATTLVGHDDFSLDAFPSKLFNLGCPDDDIVVDIGSRITVKISQSSEALSMIDTDSSQQNYNILWKWDIRPCSTSSKTISTE